MMNFTSYAIWHETGLKITADRTDSDIGSHVLRIENLNPQVETQHVLTRWELFRISMWLLWRALTR